MHKIEFGMDGIRYRMDDPACPLTLETTIQVGRALAQFAKHYAARPSVVVGRDTRPSGVWLAERLAAGLLSEGIEVYDLGIIPTPGVAHITRRVPATMGVCVSASHSPVEFNGLKVVNERGLRLQREQEMQVEALIQKCLDERVGLANVMGEQTQFTNMAELYVEHQIEHSRVRSFDGMRLVLDCANGAGSLAAPEVFRRLGAELFVMNADIRGHVINHDAGSEYVRHSPRELWEAMREHDAEYGLALDGDGDRLVVVDREQKVYDGDDLLYAFALLYQQRNLLRHNAVVVSDLANRGLNRSLERHGIGVVPSGKGDKAVEAALWGGGYLLGGEPSGNILFNDGAHTAADAIYTAIVLMELLKQTGRPLRHWVKDLRKCPQRIISKEIALPPNREMLMRLGQAAERIQFALGPNSRVSTWLSTTEPGVLRLMVEGNLENAREEVEVQIGYLEEIVKGYLPVQSVLSC